MGKPTHGNRSGIGEGSDAKREEAPPRKPEERHDNLTHTDQTPETLDERAMDAADEAGSAMLEHDKVIRQRKRD